MRKKRDRTLTQETAPGIIPRPGSKVWKGERWGAAGSPINSSGIPQVWVSWWSDEKDNYEIPLPELASSLTIDPDEGEEMPFIVVPAPKINFPIEEQKIDSVLTIDQALEVKTESPNPPIQGVKTESIITTPGVKTESPDTIYNESNLSPTKTESNDSVLTPGEFTPRDFPWNGCVTQERAGGTARSDYKYFWYKYYKDGKQIKVYIRGGHTGNAIAQMRADLIRLGIAKGKTPARLVETIQGFGKKTQRQ